MPISLERNAEIQLSTALYLFRTRSEVASDYYWRKWRRRDIRSHIYQYRVLRARILRGEL